MGAFPFNLHCFFFFFNCLWETYSPWFNFHNPTMSELDGNLKATDRTCGTTGCGRCRRATAWFWCLQVETHSLLTCYWAYPMVWILHPAVLEHSFKKHRLVSVVSCTGRYIIIRMKLGIIYCWKKRKTGRDLLEFHLLSFFTTLWKQLDLLHYYSF